MKDKLEEIVNRLEVKAGYYRRRSNLYMLLLLAVFGISLFVELHVVVVFVAQVILLTLFMLSALKRATVIGEIKMGYNILIKLQLDELKEILFKEKPKKRGRPRKNK